MHTRSDEAKPPMISVVILTYKRRDALVKSLASVRQQDCPNYEIIVVDNHSEEDVRSFLETEAPEARVIETPANVGACGGRNAGISAARGDIIVLLDNDVCFESHSELARVRSAFRERPDVHVLAFQLCDEAGNLRLREWCHPRDWEKYGQTEFETMFFVEGAAAYRRQVFEVAGAYYERLNIYNEGHDLALRLIDKGLRILYCPRIRVVHLMSPEGRQQDRTYYLYTRNYIWVAYKDYRFADGLKFVAPRIAMMLFFTVRSGRYMAFMRGIGAGILGLKDVRRERTPVSAATLRYMARLESHRPGLLTRLARHKRKPQL